MDLLIKIEVSQPGTKNEKILMHNQLISDTQLTWCREPYTVFQWAIDRMAKDLWAKLKSEGVV